MIERTERVRSAKETRAVDTTTCDGYCGDVVSTEATVDVVAGAIVGRFHEPEPHVGIADANGGYPDVEQWCVSCADARFDVIDTAAERRRKRVQRYVTAHTFGAFCLGAFLVAFIVLLF